MKYLLYFLIMVLASCQPKRNRSENNKIADTSEINSTVINNSKDFQNDSSFRRNKQVINDKIFLDFKIGMTKNEYQEKCKELINKRKLILSENQVLYKIIVDDITLDQPFKNAITLDGKANSSEENTPSKSWTLYGNVLPKFFEDTLIGISIEFKNLKSKGSSVWNFFINELNAKYISDDQDFSEFIFTGKEDSTLKLGQSKSYYQKISWVNGDIKIFLRENVVLSKVSEKKVIDEDNVILVYKSTLWSDKQNAKLLIEGKKKENVIQNDL